jgi:hypothetical protein
VLQFITFPSLYSALRLSTRVMQLQRETRGERGVQRREGPTRTTRDGFRGGVAKLERLVARGRQLERLRHLLAALRVGKSPGEPSASPEGLLPPPSELSQCHPVRT